MSDNDESKANPKVNIEALGDAPAIAMGNLYQAVAHSTGIAMENATQEQQQALIEAQAATTQGVSTIYSVDTAAMAEATRKLFDDGKP